MARKDWWYPNISKEIEAEMQKIVKKDGARFGARDKAQLARLVLAEFVAQVEHKKGIREGLTGLGDNVERRASFNDKHLL